MMWKWCQDWKLQYNDVHYYYNKELDWENQCFFLILWMRIFVLSKSINIGTHKVKKSTPDMLAYILSTVVLKPDEGNELLGAYFFLHDTCILFLIIKILFVIILITWGCDHLLCVYMNLLKTTFPLSFFAIYGLK